MWRRLCATVPGSSTPTRMRFSTQPAMSRPCSDYCTVSVHAQIVASCRKAWNSARSSNRNTWPASVHMFLVRRGRRNSFATSIHRRA
jgi:hypothetical protein